MLDKEPPLAQMWVELGVPPVHQHLEWSTKYGSSCLALVQVTKLPACDSHLKCMERYSENFQMNSSFIN